ncbi:MAG TPA: hypothetical protein VGN89_01240, partial [Phenylobacterium sp.]|nr:hypothetical protein [Phenylobacterium sp.]
MKFVNFLGLATAALVLAGSAGAQDHGGSRGVYPQSPDPIGGPDFQRSYSKVSTQDAYREKVKAYNLACTPDRRTLCSGRNSELTAWECLRLHRSKLTEPCRG